MSSSESPDFAGVDSSALSTEPLPLAAGAGPRRFGDYLLVEELGHGGMGEVWLAKQTAAPGADGVDTFCVVKTIKPNLAGDAEYKTRFVDEARIVVQLAHKNICHVFDVGGVGDDYFFAMELVAGFDFRRVFLQAKTLGIAIDEAVAVHLVCEILEALDYAHRLTDVSSGEPLHLVHRDVSQQNALVSLDGEVKLIDFGLAKSRLKRLQTEAGVVHGKLAYMAPEQARGEDVDARTDQFAAAVVAYELLAGERYYGDRSVADIAQLMITGAYRAPKLATFLPAVRAVIERALSADRNARFPSCAAMAKALSSAIAQSTGSVASSDDVRALLDRLFPGARGEHRTRMASALHAANAAIVVPVEPTTRIASAMRHLRTPENDSHRIRTELSDVAPLEGPHTDVDGHDDTKEVAPTTNPSRRPPGSTAAGFALSASDTTTEEEPVVLVTPPARPPHANEANTVVVAREDVRRSTERVDAEPPRSSTKLVAAIAIVAACALTTTLALKSRRATNDAEPPKAIEHAVTTAPPPIVTAPASPPIPATPPPPSATTTTTTTPDVAPATAATSPSTPMKSKTRRVKPKTPEETSASHQTEATGPANTEHVVVIEDTKPARPPLPSTVPLAMPELFRVLEASCADVVPCATQLRSRFSEAHDLAGAKAVRAAGEQCFTDCKRKLP